MEIIVQTIACVLCVALFFYLVVVSIDLFKYLASNYPGESKSELHSRDRYKVAEDMKNDDESDLGIFMN